MRRRRELELLDLELELHQRQLAGAETQQLQRRLQLLRASGQSRPHRAGGRSVPHPVVCPAHPLAYPRSERTHCSPNRNLPSACCGFQFTKILPRSSIISLDHQRNVSR